MARKLLYLNGLAIIGAVLNHTAGWGYVAMFYWVHRYLNIPSPDFSQVGSASYYALRFIEQTIIVSIPAFLFVSGFFVAFATRKSQTTVEWKFVRTRIRYLAIPYLIWSFIMLLVQAVQGSVLTPVEYLRSIFLGETTAAFYFVPLIIQLYLLAPLLVPLARKNASGLILVSALLLAVVHIIRYFQILNIALPVPAFINTFAAGWFFPGNLFWFAFGMVFSFHQQVFKTFLSRYRWHLLISALVLFALGMLEWELLLSRSGEAWITPKETLLDTVFAFAFLLAFLAFEQVPNQITRILEELGSRSFGIYLIHSLVLEVFARGVYHLAPWMLGLQILFQPLLIASGIGIPLLLMELVKRTPARKYYSYQFG